MTPRLLAILILTASLAHAEESKEAKEAKEAKAIAEACRQRRVNIRVAPAAEGGDAEKDTKAADRYLGMRSRIEDGAPGGSTVSWDRGHGEESCRRKLTALAKQFPDRLRFPDVERRQMREAGQRMTAQVPAAVRKDPTNTGLQAGLFDASGNHSAGSGSAVYAGEALRDAAASSPSGPAPRASMPSSYTRPATEPPVPAGLSAAAASAYSGGASRVRRGGLAIDTDGDLSHGDPGLSAIARRDPNRQRATALTYSNGRSLDPTRVPFVVIPKGDRSARMGDFVVVEYNGRRAIAIVGDVGPRNKFGEGSMALARSLGINPDGVRGGVEGGVTYSFLGSGVGRPSDEGQVLAQMQSTLLALK